MGQLDPAVVPAIVGGLFIVILLALAYLNREWSPRWAALEAAILCGISVVLARSALVSIEPLLFAVLLYVITHRSRILTDVANLVSGWGYQDKALGMFRLALRMARDPGTRSIVHISMGTSLIRKKRPQDAADAIEQALSEMPQQRGRPKYEAAGRYNLGHAYRALGREKEASEQFRQAIELAPNSPYAKGAEVALKGRGRRSQ